MITEDDLLAALWQYAGIDAVQTGEASLRSEIRRALAATTDPQRLLDFSSPEWNALLESALVPETWFFRNIEAFEALAGWVTRTWLPAHPGERLTVLSLPCATGEEAYSLAICLLEAGLSPTQFRIRAGDISHQSLARAREACYRRNSFRTGFDRARFGKFFDPLGDDLQRVAPRVRELVDFERMNLVKPEGELPQSQVIFCRNALIYFDLETQRAALANLRGALTADGMLFLGPVEPPVALQCGFATAGLPMAFACVKQSDRPLRPVPVAAAAPVRRVLPAAPVVSVRPRAVMSVRREERPAVPAPVRSLETARALANAGDGVAAAEMLDGMAATAAADPEYFCLRGVVSEALGCPDLAEACYRKALYLDPVHLETLTHLAALLEVSGRREAAAQLRRRANRSSHP